MHIANVAEIVERAGIRGRYGMLLSLLTMSLCSTADRFRSAIFSPDGKLLALHGVCAAHNFQVAG